MRRFIVFIALFVSVPILINAQIANHVVISEIYGGGGNSGATYTHDFVELYNPTDAPITMTNWSIQYQSATGTGAFGLRAVFSGTIQPKRFFLIQLVRGTGGTTPLPTPDASPASPPNLSATAGKVVLVRGSDFITNPTDSTVVDFVGYGSTANKFEGSGPTPAPSNTTSIERKASATSTTQTMGIGGTEEFAGNGWDSNNNANDFVTRSPQPQNSASPAEPTATAPVAGIGTAAVTPTVVKAADSLSISLTLRGVQSNTITKALFIVPPPLTWSRTASDVALNAAGTPSVQVRQDSIIVSGLTVAASDSAIVTLRKLSAPDTTLRLTWRVETAAGGDSTASISSPPTILFYGTPQPIFDMRANDAQGVPLLKDQLVTVRGIVTSTTHLGSTAYMQDVSGGIAVFDNTFIASRQLGDEVTVTGTMAHFNGLSELTKVIVHEVHTTGNTVTPLLLTVADVVRDGQGGVELYEGMLVQLNRVRVLDSNNQPVGTWSTASPGPNYKLFDATDTATVRIVASSGIAGSSAPQGEFDIVGIVGQFKTSSPFIGGYQILPRSRDDIIATGPIITIAPVESDITPTSLTVSWETLNPGSSHLRYGLTPSFELGVASVSGQRTSHAVNLSGLSPATVYHVRAFSVSGTDTSFATGRVVSTASQGSSGQINVYFNKSVDVSVARYGNAQGNVTLLQRLLQRVERAQFSIDAALYSLSGAVGDSIARALVRAKGRGLKVRMIIEKDNLTPRPDGSIPGTSIVFEDIIAPSGIPFIRDDFDAANRGVGLHHNKFFVFDYRGGTPDRMWVWTGSWNPTDPGTNDDRQNAVEIQDHALAQAYTMEFNEMWGSETDTPNASASRFGSRKTDNTPHVFSIGGVHVELYFSPSDRTTSQIIRTLNTAGHSIYVGMLTLTRSDIAQTLVAKKNDGRRVRVVLNDSTATGTQYGFLRSSGVDVRVLSPPGLMHHKYAVVDADVSQGIPSQYVITGSHNWTSAAENSNSENTLIILNNRIANEYLQEFAARYKEAGGTGNIVVGVETSDATSVFGELSFSLEQNYPNPFNPATVIRYSIPVGAIHESPLHVTLKVFNALGQEVAELVNDVRPVGRHQVKWESTNAASGVYFYRLEAAALDRSGRRFVETKRMLLLK